jgi:hypothetical protein
MCSHGIRIRITVVVLVGWLPKRKQTEMETDDGCCAAVVDPQRRRFGGGE